MRKERLRVDEQIRPEAFRAGGRVGCVRYIPGNDSNVIFFEGIRMPRKFKRTAVGVADADFQTVVKVQTPAWDVRNLPVFSGEQKNREL